MRSLSRVMVKPEFRGLGLAKKIVSETLLLVETPHIECVCRNDIIIHVLENCGFTNHDIAPNSNYRYLTFSA
jgi:GNAT superfamily N-acetyltransferase